MRRQRGDVCLSPLNSPLYLLNELYREQELVEKNSCWGAHKTGWKACEQQSKASLSIIRA